MKMNERRIFIQIREIPEKPMKKGALKEIPQNPLDTP